MEERDRHQILEMMRMFYASEAISAIFNSKRKKKIAASYKSRTKNSKKWYDWILNLFKSIGDAF